MIKALRVDERLIHGQIAMVWSKELGIDGIVVANDETAANETQQMALKMAVPSGIKVIIKTVAGAIDLVQDPRAEKMKLLILVRTVHDAVSIAKSVSNILYMNIGNVGKAVQANKTTFTQFVMLTDEETACLKELVHLYPETALQNVPGDKRELASNVLKKMNL